MASQGGVMYSKQECFKQLTVAKTNAKGEKLKNKKGKYIYKKVNVPVKELHDVNALKLPAEEGNQPETLVFYTRKCVPVRRVLNLSQTAYDYFISKEVPEGFFAPKNFEPICSIHKIPLVVQAWNSLSLKQRIEWHLRRIASSLNSTVESYVVYDD